MEKWGSDIESLQDIREQLLKQGIERTPPALKEYEEFDLDDIQLAYVSDFYRLSRSRAISEAGLGAITYTEIVSFLKLGLSDVCFNEEDVRDYVQVITFIDNKFREYHSKEAKRQLDAIKSKRK